MNLRASYLVPSLLAACACVGAGACSDDPEAGTEGSGTAPDIRLDAGNAAARDAGVTGDSGASGGPVSTYYDAGIVVSPEQNPCATQTNPAGAAVDLAWPAALNTGHDALEGNTIHFHWDDEQPHNVIELPLWRGQSPPQGKYANSGWAGQLTSGAKTTHGSFDWNTGVSPCGWRPGLYYLADEDNAAGGIVAVSLTVPEGQNDHYGPNDCAVLADPLHYRARYASYATREKCRQFEVNNFQTEAHYDWVSPTFAANQGDLVLFRWTGLHNVVQVHDQSKDEPFASGGIFSGPRTNCVGGPNYGCANGDLSLGEYLLDTTDYRPGMVHISDQCAYGCESCPWDCDNVTNDTPYYGTPFLLFVQRPVRPTPPVTGACCAIDKSKGQACRVVDLYNDNEGVQFDTGLGGAVTVNRGDLVRFRWGGALKVVQTTAVTTSTGVASKNPMPNGAAMDHATECVPGPHWTCLGAGPEQGEFVFDVNQALNASHFETFSYGGKFFDFYAFADNSNDTYDTNQDSPILLPVGNEAPYTDNPPCP